MSDHTKTTCKTMLQEDVKESLALVTSLKLSLDIAQCKLCKDEERLAEVEFELASTSGAEIASQGHERSRVGKFEWEPSCEEDELACRRQVEFKGKAAFARVLDLEPSGGKGYGGNSWTRRTLAEEREAKAKANTKGKGKYS